VFNKRGELIAVLDIDSNQPDAFTQQDAAELEKILHAVFAK
jgi:L-methionine (R)-S-oxide reductase